MKEAQMKMKGATEHGKFREYQMYVRWVYMCFQSWKKR